MAGMLEDPGVSFPGVVCQMMGWEEMARGFFQKSSSNLLQPKEIVGRADGLGIICVPGVDGMVSG